MSVPKRRRQATEEILMASSVDAIGSILFFVPPLRLLL